MKTFKNILFAAFLASFMFLFSANTLAQGAPDKGQNGIGIIIGDPTGISFKNWTSSSTAFDIGAAWSLENNDAISLHADYLWHNYLNVEQGDLAFYYGIGARALLIENADSRIGARIPVGLNYFFAEAPFDIFVEIAPIFDVIPETDFNGDGGIGIRYNF